MFFILNNTFVKHLPPKDFVTILENDKLVLESFLESAELHETIYEGNMEGVMGYLEPVIPTMSDSLKEKLRLYMD